MKRIFVLCLLAAAGAVCTQSCVPSTRMMVNVTNTKGKPVSAQIFVDGELIGNAPATKKTSNGVWNSPEIRAVADGYVPYSGEAVKEVKVANIVIGLFNWWAFLWCYGPKKQQNILLMEDK